MPPAISATSLPPEGTAPADRPARRRSGPRRVEACSQASRGQPGPPRQPVRRRYAAAGRAGPRPGRDHRAPARCGSPARHRRHLFRRYPRRVHGLASCPGPARSRQQRRRRPAGRRGPRCRPACQPAAGSGPGRGRRRARRLQRYPGRLRQPAGRLGPARTRRPRPPRRSPARTRPPGRTPAGCWTRPPQRRTPAPGGTATPRNGSGCPGSARPRGSSSQRSGRQPGTTGPRSGSTSASGDSPGACPRGFPWRSPEPPTSSPAGWSVPATATRGRGGQPGVCTRPPRPSPAGS